MLSARPGLLCVPLEGGQPGCGSASGPAPLAAPPQPTRAPVRWLWPTHWARLAVRPYGGPGSKCDSSLVDCHQLYFRRKFVI